MDTMVLQGVGNEVRSAINWGVAHGVPRVFIGRAESRGDLQAALIRSRSNGEDRTTEVIEEIRARGPLYKGVMGYVATSHSAVRQVLTSDDFRSGFPGSDGAIGRLAVWSGMRGFHPVEPPSLLVTEPPDHTRYRKLVMRVFTRRAVQKLTDRTQEVADRLLDDLEGRGGRQVDLVEAYCSQLPLTIIAEILGVPEEDRPRVLEFGEAAAPSLDLGLDYAQHRRVRAGLQAFDQWLTVHLDNLRRNPGDNLLSELVAVRDEDGGLDELELKATAGLVLAAGFETTVNLLSNGIALLHDHPEQRKLLEHDPSLWANAVEEVLRVDPPVLLTGRMALRDTVVAGRAVSAGSMVTTVLAGANRDPEVFDDPMTFDVARPNARDHISFSAGRHHCLGAALARMEGEIGLRSLWERYPDLRLLPGAQRRTTRLLRGFETQPAILRP
ncbi:cytochrome P450 [Nocardioides piscis]|uniref:Cytochrome P450 n=1 Tax=Nocardioides piscis TaxID=2714938 RepID=A0A6G7YC30_9ACTN|nr:cytochrome P450 [Nocardioides piscis]QIK74167.1 cytochrome P450 [Nocardioides piscis]